MRVLSAKKELSEVLVSHHKSGQTIGFVPTMGALHAGHFSLINKSRKQNDLTLVSIFVNPLQFNNASDLADYPRVLSEDISSLEELGVDVLFCPDEKEIYPEEPMVSINFGSLSDKMEGRHRPGHFEGVGVVVAKLLHLVRPRRAYFGLKDLQQFLLIRRMCEDLNFGCEVVGVETVREASGLALSSRNRRLTDAGRIQAQVIYRGLMHFKEGVEKGTAPDKLKEQIVDMYDKESGFDLEYLEIIDPRDLSSVDNFKDLSELALCVAGYVEGVRLIDNYICASK